MSIYLDKEDKQEYLLGNSVGQCYHRYMKVLSVLGYSWLIVSGVYILVKDTSKGVSIVAITLHMGVSMSYLTYGILRRDSVIITGSIVSIISNFFVMLAIFIVNSSEWS